jgi:hypothetical protein
MAVWKRRLTALVAALGAVGMLMSSAEAREPRDRDNLTPPTFSPGSSVTFPPFPTTTPPPTMPPNTLPPSVDDRVEDIIDTLEEFGDTFQEIIDFLSNPFAV